MGIEYTFSQSPVLKALRTFLFTMSLVDLISMAMNTTLYIMHFSQLKSIHYLVFILNSLHFFTWVSSSVLSGTGHGIPLDYSTTIIVTLALFSDIGAVIAQTYTPLSLGLFFKRMSTIYTRLLLAITIINFPTYYLMKAFGARQMAEVQDFIIKKESSFAEAERITRIHIYTMYKKRAIRAAISIEISIFPIAFLIFFVHRIFFGGGYILLLLATFPCSILWLYTLSIIGTPTSRPPDGSSDLGEIVAVTFAHFIGAMFGSILLFISGFLPDPHGIYYFWQISSIISGIAIFILAYITILLTSIVKSAFDEYSSLKPIRKHIEDLKTDYRKRNQFLLKK